MLPIIIIALVSLNALQASEEVVYSNYTTTLPLMTHMRLQWPYKNTKDIVHTHSEAGEIFFNNYQLTASTGTDSGSYSTVTSKKNICLGGAQKGEIELHTFFSTPVEGTIQIIGIGNEENGYFFGYNGTDFGILHRHGGKQQIHTLSINNAPENNGTINIQINSKPPVIIPINETDSIGEVTKKIANADFSSTGFSARYYGDKVIFTSDLAESYTGIFSVTETGLINSVESFVQTITGVTPQEDWTLQDDWNIQSLSDLELNKGQTFLILCDGIGYGYTKFSIRDPFEGSIVNVHTLSHGQDSTTPSLSSPLLPLSMSVKNNNQNKNVSITCAAMSASLHESNIDFGTTIHTYNQKSLTASEKVLLVLRAPLLDNNHAPITCPKIKSLDFGASNNSNTLLKVIKNPTLKGTPVFTTIEESNGVEVDTNIDEYTGGTLVYSALVPKYTQKYYNFDQSLTLEPGDILAFVGKNANEIT